MESIPVTVDLTQQIIDDICASTNYQDTITDEEGVEVPNPQSKIDRVAYSLQIFAQQQAINYETKQATVQAHAEISQNIGGVL